MYIVLSFMFIILLDVKIFQAYNTVQSLKKKIKSVLLEDFYTKR